MKQYCLKISSKNEKSLNIFLAFISKHFKTKFNIIKKSISAQNKTKILTILKSPHVNKTAQEQFEFRTFSKQILIKSAYLEKNIIFLKRVLNRSFHDISIALKFVANLEAPYKNQRLVFYPDNFRLVSSYFFNTNLKRNKQKIAFKKNIVKKNLLLNLTQFLTIISVFGETAPLSSKTLCVEKVKNSNPV
jgi:ribosomal protein S10